MKPHPRIRKTIEWGGTAVTVLLVVVWVASGWWSVKFVKSWRANCHVTFGIGTGALGFERDSMNYYQTNLYPPDNGYRLTAHRFAISWMPRQASSLFQWGLTVPLWPIAGVICAASMVAWRLDTLACRRAKLNLCPNCNYDRAGLARHAKCPECGTIPPTI